MKGMILAGGAGTRIGQRPESAQLKHDPRNRQKRRLPQIRPRKSTLQITHCSTPRFPLSIVMLRLLKVGTSRSSFPHFTCGPRSITPLEIGSSGRIN